MYTKRKILTAEYWYSVLTLSLLHAVIFNYTNYPTGFNRMSYVNALTGFLGGVLFTVWADTGNVQLGGIS